MYMCMVIVIVSIMDLGCEKIYETGVGVVSERGQMDSAYRFRMVKQAEVSQREQMR